MAIQLRSIATSVRNSRPSKTSAILTVKNSRNARTYESAENDSINLTTMVTNLQKAEQLLSLIPVVNTQYVSNVAQAINNGDYEINSEQVADKIIRLEQQFAERPGQ